MSEIEVKIDAVTGELSVWNDGPGIEPVPHKSGLISHDIQWFQKVNCTTKLSTYCLL